MPFAAFIPLIAAGITAASQYFGARKQAKENKALAKYQSQANERYLQEQLAYNTPKAQMGRFQDAGLNPHLIYGQGNPGNQSAPLASPDIKPTDYQSMFDVVSAYNQSKMVQSQVQAQDAATRQKTALAELNKLQAKVMAANPLLDAAGFSAIISSLKSTAEIKANEAKADIPAMQQHKMSLESGKIWKEMEMLDQRFRLNELDGRIKAQVVQSKEFQNAILEVQKRFMTDSEITPQHVLQFVQLLLMKMIPNAK